LVQALDHVGIVKRAAALAIAGALLTEDAVRLGVASASAVPDAHGSVHVHSSLANRTISPPRVSVRYSLKPIAYLERASIRASTSLNP
jgi:hypothetical protein